MANNRPLISNRTECMVCNHSMNQQTLHANWLETTVTAALVELVSEMTNDVKF